MEWIQRFLYALRHRGLEEYGKYYSVYRGIVHSVDDPEARGRIMVECPVVFGQDVYEYWALPRSMYAGTQRGQFALPAKGDAVWVTFEGGNKNAPLWEYGWFGEDDVPERIKDDYPNIQAWQFQDCRIELDGTNGVIRIVRIDGKTLEINKDGISLGSPDASKEPAVLGDTNSTTLKDISEQLKNLTTLLNQLNTSLTTFTTVQTSASGAVSPLNLLTPAYQSLGVDLVHYSAEFPAILTNLEHLINTEIDKTKSTSVSLD